MKKVLTKKSIEIIKYWNKTDDISGNLNGISGDLSGISGDLSEIRGDLDTAEITEVERRNGVTVEELIMSNL